MAFRVVKTTVTDGAPVKVFEAIAVNGSADTASAGISVAQSATWFRFHVRPGDQLWAHTGVSPSSYLVHALVRSA